ncbi:MAG TPA: glutamyl-tRNA reductase [Thermogutta sp.]|nr:glutamyl-tRNA reductase [Thermogutta sp.]
MEICVVGCSHQTAPLAIREKLAFSPEQTRAALQLWEKRFPWVEAVLLSTCNRVEIYLASEMATIPPATDVVDFLGECHGLTRQDFADLCFALCTPQSLEHLFRVAAGLESMVLGEPQILFQVKQAYQWATEMGTVGPLLHIVFQGAFRAARRVASETEIQKRRVSIPSIAVSDFGRAVFERFEDKLVLVIGAGKMAEETIRYLRAEGAQRIVIINRHLERAHQLAERCQGEVRPWEELAAVLREADVVVSTTGAEQPIVTREMLSRVIAARLERPLFVLDLAVPRDFEPAIATMPGVYLYCLDDLMDVCQKNREARDKELPRADEIVAQEVGSVLANLRQRTVGPVIQQLRKDWESVKEQELRRLFNKLSDLDPAIQAEIRLAFDRLINKLLHPPLSSLREYSQSGAHQEMIEAIRKLFRHS